MKKFDLSRSGIIMLGVFLLIVQAISIGMTNWIYDTKKFIILSMCAQALGGLGSGITTTSFLAIISSYGKENRERYIGFVEAANGLGILFGPITGAGLYYIGGFPLPFFFFASLFLIGYPFISYVLMKHDKDVR